MSNNLPLARIPPVHKIKILRKMRFREVARLRQTCHDIDDLVHQNAAVLRFPVDGANLTVIIDRQQGMLLRTNVDIQKWDLESGLAVPSVRCDPAGLECALFDEIAPWMNMPDSEIDTVARLFEDNNISARCLYLFFPIYRRESDLLRLYTASGASTMMIDTISIDDSLNYPFEFLEKALDVGCKKLKVQACGDFPPDYPELLSKFETIHIGNVKQTVGDLPLAPIIQKMISNSNMPLRYFTFPFYQKFISKKEMDELDLERWHFDITEHVKIFTAPFHYLVETVKDYIIIYRIEGELRCKGYRIAKENIEEFVLKWADIYLRLQVSYDLSGLFEFFQENQEDFEGIKKQLVDLVGIVYSYDAPLVNKRKFIRRGEI